MRSVVGLLAISFLVPCGMCTCQMARATTVFLRLAVDPDTMPADDDHSHHCECGKKVDQVKPATPEQTPTACAATLLPPPLTTDLLTSQSPPVRPPISRSAGPPIYLSQCTLLI